MIRKDQSQTVGSLVPSAITVASSSKADRTLSVDGHQGLRPDGSVGKRGKPNPSSAVKLRDWSRLGRSRFADGSHKARLSAAAPTRENLFTIIIPAGCGKTTLAKRYGLVDVDQLITDVEHDMFAEERLELLSGSGTWTAHNNKWYARLNKTLDLLDYTMPVILLCHTEELSDQLGGVPLGYLKLSEAAHTINIKNRSKEGKLFSTMNLSTSFPSAKVKNRYVVGSNQELEAKFLEILNVSNFPIACPLKYSTHIWNSTYDRSVPHWVMTGERAGTRSVNLADLVSMFDRGLIPKEAVDYHVRQGYAPTQFDFGVTMFEWSTELGKLPPTMNSHRKFDLKGDMMDIFPPKEPMEVSRSNVTVRNLIQTFDIFSHPDALSIAERHVGEPQVFVTSLLCEWKGVLQFSSVSDIVYKWFGVAHGAWSNRLKSLHSLVRTSRFLMHREITESDRQAIMYMDLLVGRGRYTIDEMGEVNLRQSDTYDTKHLSFDPVAKRYTSEQYKKDFSSAMSEAYLRIKTNPAPINVDSFMDFYESRYKWLTKGGLVSNTLPPGMKQFSSSVLDSVANTVIEIKGRHNKKSLFETSEIWDVLRGLMKIILT